jgi:hypothetical protein
MQIENYELVGSYNNQRFPNIDAERSINLFEYIDAKGKKPNSLISTSGILNTGFTFPGSAPTDGFRAEFVLNGFEYYVIGPNIYRRDSNDVISKLNPIPLRTSSGYVGVDANNNANGSQILFVDGVAGYIWDTGSNNFTYDIRGRFTGVTGIAATDGGFPFSPIDVCFLDGFLVVANAGNQALQIPDNTFQLSAFNNAYSWTEIVNAVVSALAATDVITLIAAENFPVGMPIEFTTNGGGTLPVPLVAGTIYYVIPIDSTHIKVAATFANAVAGIPIDLTVDGILPIQTTNDGQLQQGQINTHPGPIVACRTLHRRLFLFSINYIEVWENSGQGTNLPFRRNNSLLMEYGTPAIGSIVTGFDKMIFLSNDKDGLGAVMEVDGTAPFPISNRALDFQLAQYAQLGQVSDAKGIFIKENGIIFYRLNFTAANHTFVYNVTFSNPQTEEGRRWHEEEVLNGNRHPAQTHGYFNGNNYYGSYNQPILYFVDNSLVTNDGETIPRIRIGRPYVPATYNRTRCDRFMVDIIQGLAEVEVSDNILDLLTEGLDIITTEDDLDILLQSSGSPEIFNPDDHVIYLSLSKDGGVTYGYRQSSTIGGVGKRTRRTVWRKLGVIPRGQAFVPKVEFFGHISLVILGAAWAYEVMPQ